MKCDFCGKDESLPFVCNYCGGAFCADHRLPEAHQCKGDLSKRRTIVAPPQTTFSWQQPQQYTSPFQPASQARVFSAVEIRDIIVAWAALGFAFALANWSRFGIFGSGSVSAGEFAYIFGLALVTIGPGFVFHELSHKFVARKYGFWAEFRMWPQMLILALLTSLLGFIFAAPGATYISGMNISKEENGKISIAGPLINVAIALFFLPFALFGSGVWFDLGYWGSYFNIFLALFNLLPIGPLDGSKVFRWNKVLWVVTIASLALLFYYLYFA